MGIFFRAKREQLLDAAEPQKKRNLCRWVRSGLIAWKNGRYEPISRFSSFFNQAAGRRCSFAFPSISPPRRIVIYGTLIPPRKEQSSSPDAISPFTCTIRFRFVVLLFCCFDALCNRDEWFEIEDGFEIGVTRTVETTCMNLWDRMSVLFLHLSFTSRWELESTSLSQKFISVLSSPVK